jgi:phosphoserine phosphatase RsbU/P
MANKNSSLLTPRKILIVEDEKSLSDSLAKKFTSLDFEPVVVNNGNDVEEIVKNNHFDIILLDILLPGKDGFEILKSLKNNEATEKIPVIMLTNLGEMENMERCLDIGANDYCIKTNTSLEQIEKLLRKYVVFYDARQNLQKN